MKQTQVVPTSRKRQDRLFRKLLLALGILAIAATSLHCGIGYPPRLWKCECRQVCQDRSPQGTTTQTTASQSIAVSRMACGYSREDASNHARYHYQRSVPALSGCKKVAYQCNSCKVSKQRVCLRKPGTRNRTFLAFVDAWIVGVLEDAANADTYDDDDFYEPDEDEDDPGPPPGYGPVQSGTNNPSDWGTNPSAPGDSPSSEPDDPDDPDDPFDPDPDDPDDTSDTDDSDWGTDEDDW